MKDPEPKVSIDELSAKAMSVLMKGDLSALSDADRTAYYLRVCESLGLNPLTRPFDFMLAKGPAKDETRLIL